MHSPTRGQRHPDPSCQHATGTCSHASSETPVLDMVLSHLFLHCNLEDSKNTRATRGLVDNYLQIAAAAMEVPQETQMQVVCVSAKGDQAGKKLANTIKSARSSNKMALGQLLQRAMANLTTDMMRLVAHVNKRLDVLEATVAAQGARIATLEADPHEHRRSRLL